LDIKKPDDHSGIRSTKQCMTIIVVIFPWQHYLPRFIGYDLSLANAKHPFEIWCKLIEIIWNWLQKIILILRVQFRI